MLKKIIFILKNKFCNRTKVSLNTYLKNIGKIDIGKNSVINSNCSMDATKGEILLGNNVILNRYSYLNAYKGSIQIGNGSEINNFTIINGSGEVIIGNNVLIGPNVQIISYQHNYLDKNIIIKHQGIKKGKIIIEDDVWIGASSIILAGVTIKHGAVIGASSVVTKNVEEYDVVIGSPAKSIKQRK